jgi:putative IMPACT (imprinted ancient) family translation regulator
MNMRELAAIKYIVNRSRFFAHLYEIKDQINIKEILKYHKKKYKKSNHHCYALIIKIENKEESIELYKDDGEVGHPGRILLDLLKKYNFKNHALVVSRVYGGINLGVGGVARAFRKSGESVIKYHIRI